jgi:hypothetical protein
MKELVPTVGFAVEDILALPAKSVESSSSVSSNAMQS